MTYEEAAGILISQAIVLGRASGKSTIERIRIEAICKAVEALEKQATQEWISVDDKLPENFISVLGYMTDAGEFPPVRECYTVGNAFFFPALGDVNPVSHWCEMPQPPKGE